jgi:hypothetical protein
MRTDLTSATTWLRLSVLLLLLAAVSTAAHATGFQLIVDRPVDLSPSSPTAPVTLRFNATGTDSCSMDGTCRTRSAIAVQIAPCPPGAGSCVGPYAIYFENREQTSNFEPMRFELTPGVEYTVSGEWTLEQSVDEGNGCDVLRCVSNQDFGQTFFIADLVTNRPLDWSALKTRW